LAPTAIVTKLSIRNFPLGKPTLPLAQKGYCYPGSCGSLVHGTGDLTAVMVMSYGWIRTVQRWRLSLLFYADQVVSCQFSGRARNGAGMRGDELMFDKPSTKSMAPARERNYQSRKLA